MACSPNGNVDEWNLPENRVTREVSCGPVSLCFALGEREREGGIERGRSETLAEEFKARHARSKFSLKLNWNRVKKRRYGVDGVVDGRGNLLLCWKLSFILEMLMNVWKMLFNEWREGYFNTVKIGNVHVLLSKWMKYILYIFECWNVNTRRKVNSIRKKRWYNWWKKFIGDDSSDEWSF